MIKSADPWIRLTLSASFKNRIRLKTGCDNSLKSSNSWSYKIESQAYYYVLSTPRADWTWKTCRKILQNKLENCGVRDVVSEPIVNWFSDRKREVVVDGSMSNLCRLELGVPQGSILGPLPCIAYINDLSNFAACSPRLYRRYLPCFARQWLVPITTENQFRTRKFKTWFGSNELTMNIKKTAGKLIIQPTIKLRSFKFNISLCNEQIPLVNSYKYLGISYIWIINFVF